MSTPRLIPAILASVIMMSAGSAAFANDAATTKEPVTQQEHMKKSAEHHKKAAEHHQKAGEHHKKAAEHAEKAGEATSTGEKKGY